MVSSRRWEKGEALTLVLRTGEFRSLARVAYCQPQRGDGYAVGVEFLDPAGLNPEVRWFGLSWVAVWTLLFTVVIPTRPGRAVMAALASVSSVPVVIWFEITTYPISFKPGPAQFFFGLVFPYLLVVVMAYVGARVVYALGTEVSAGNYGPMVVPIPEAEANARGNVLTCTP